MHYVYILKSQKDSRLYIGYTTNILNRIHQHNRGDSAYTKKFRPWKLAYFEGYANEEDAKEREKQLKHYGKAYSHLKRKIMRSLRDA